ncbi:unnamed protein product [Moneuplotes crassus]|uniref:Uncharacterized protein n=1 Tax=Euplotes crassus TaxID=5936 RepID=A0AAD2CZB6_EUPCR|nr:unnamed protein product [Moneuplotes crassus]
METLSFGPDKHEDIVTRTLAVMQQKGVSEKLLSGLIQDKGFNKFCTEWLAQRWDICIERNHCSTDQILALKNQVKSQKVMISKIMLQGLKVQEAEVNEAFNSLHSSLVCLKKVTIEGFLHYDKLPTDLFLDLNEPEGYLLCKALNTQRLPDCNSMNIAFNKKPWVNKKFIKDIFPPKINELWLENYNFRPEDARKMTLNKYFSELIKVFPIVQNHVNLYKFEISQSQFRKIFSSCRDKPELEFNSCKIHIETPLDLSKPLSGCKITKLNFNSCGRPQFSNWGENLQEFEHLIQALSHSVDLKRSMSVLIFLCSCVPAEDFERIFIKHDMNLDLVPAIYR